MNTESNTASTGTSTATPNQTKPASGLATDRVLRNVAASRTKLRELFDSPTTERP